MEITFNYKTVKTKKDLWDLMDYIENLKKEQDLFGIDNDLLIRNMEVLLMDKWSEFKD